MKRKAIHAILSEHEMDELASLIGRAEKTTEGEIRVALREKRHFGEGKLRIHELALKEFHRLGMHRTAQRTGVLIFLLVSERKFHIVADEGIHTKVADGTWDAVAADMGSKFREGKFFDGLSAAVLRVGEILSAHFPVKPGDTNELPNTVSIS